MRKKFNEDWPHYKSLSSAPLPGRMSSPSWSVVRSTSSTSSSFYTPRPFSREELYSAGRRSFSPSSTFLFLPPRQEGEKSAPPQQQQQQQATLPSPPNSSHESREKAAVVADDKQSTGNHDKVRPRSASLERTSLRIRMVNNAPELNSRKQQQDIKSLNAPELNSRKQQLQQQDVGKSLDANLTRRWRDKNGGSNGALEASSSLAAVTQSGKLTKSTSPLAESLPPKPPPSYSKSQTLPKARRPLKGILRKTSITQEAAEEGAEPRDVEEDVFDGDAEAEAPGENWPKGGRIRIPRLIGVGVGGARANRSLALKIFERLEADAERALPIRKTKSLSDVGSIAERGDRGLFADYFDRVAREKKEAEQRLNRLKEERQERTISAKKTTPGGELTSEEFVRRILLGEEKERSPVRRQQRQRRASASAAAILAWRSNNLGPENERRKEASYTLPRASNIKAGKKGQVEAEEPYGLYSLKIKTVEDSIAKPVQRKDSYDADPDSTSAHQASPGFILETHRSTSIPQYPIYIHCI